MQSEYAAEYRTLTADNPAQGFSIIVHENDLLYFVGEPVSASHDSIVLESKCRWFYD